MWRVWKWGHFSVRSSDLRRLARRAEGEATAVGEVWRLLRVRELPLVDPATKATNSSSEAMLRRETGVSSWDGILDKTLPSTQVKIWSQNQLEERAKLEVDLLFGLGDRPPFSPLPRLLLCFRPCSLISRQPRFVWPTLSDPGTACLSPFARAPGRLAFPSSRSGLSGSSRRRHHLAAGLPESRNHPERCWRKGARRRVEKPRSDREAGSAASSGPHAPLLTP